MKKDEVLRIIEEAARNEQTELNLSSNQLTALPAEIVELKNITTLNLSENQLTALPAEIVELKNITTLFLSGNQLKRLPAEIVELKNITTLFLSGNQLTPLPAEIGKLTNLTGLFLSRNQLETLPAEIGKLTNLTELDLSWNQLKTLPTEIVELKTLTELDLSWNQLKTLPAEIVELKTLTELDLSGNQLEGLPAEIVELTNLTELSLSWNQLKTLPAEIVELTNLTTLDLSWNQLKTLPAEIVELKTLTTLDLTGNQLMSLPAEIVELKTLTTLDLSGNQLTSLPAEIAELKTLTELDLSGNQLKTLPAEIGKLKNLTELDLSENQLKTLPAEIAELKTLTTLYLTRNQLKTLPAEIVELKNLTTLYLTGNQLKTLPAEIGKLKNLTVLDLTGNQLTSLPAEIGKLKNLTVLDLTGNQLETLPAEIAELKTLTELNLSWNQLTSLPAEIVELKNLTALYLYGNPLKSPPPEIVERGIEAIRSYFKSLKGEKQPLNEVKVLLVGDGGAGKTSLVKQLLGEAFDRHEPQTHGINLRDWKVEDIHVHFWDFGGQEIMYATHQFFLSKRSLYILVLDGWRDEKTEYWLKHIETFGGDSPILVVLNKIDENQGFNVNRKFLQEKYKGIMGFYRVSCANGQGIKDFTGALSKVLANVELIETTWATSWFNVKTQLEDMTENFITIDEYKEMCSGEDITEKTDQDTLADFLNDLGVILHFKDFELLDTYVLDPKWLTEAVYRILNSKNLADSNGVLKLDLLGEILKKEADDDYYYYYPSRKYRYIIDLMKKFELCYEIDKETVLLPDLLEVQEPKFDFDYDAALKFVIEYDFLPRSVMPRFIVKMHRDIASELRWRTGVVLEDKAFHSTAVIKADELDERIDIYVDGEQKRDYFSTIRKTFRDINDSFEKLEAKEMVPLPDNDEIAIEYEELIGYEQMGREEFIVGKTRKAYSVSELLAGIEKMEERLKDFVHIDIHNTVSQMAKIETQKQKIKIAKRKEIIELNSQDEIKLEKYLKINPLYEEALERENRKKYLSSIDAYEKIIDITEFYKKAWEGLERIYNSLGESEKRNLALEKIRLITEIIDFETNAAQKINLQQLKLQNLDFFDNLFWTFQPQINILLGKNGYGKTYLLRLLISLLQKDNIISSDFFTGSKSKSFVRCNLERNNTAKVIHRTKTVFKESIGKVPVLAIPDMRFVDKSKTTISHVEMGEDKGDLREYGAYHFLYEESYDLLIQNFLYELCIIYMDHGKSFESPIFDLLTEVVRELTDKEFEFDEIVAIGNAKFEIKVITEGNKKNPLPIQKASQGTLSVLSIFGLIYYYLKSVFDTEEELLKKPAIVFIDEVDAHLHPTWQQRIIGLLRKNFPNVQFVVTAHSPLVVAGCYENEVAVLRKGEKGFTIKNFERHFIGISISELLKEAFETEDIDDTYLYYATQLSLQKDNSARIKELESKETLVENEEMELNNLYKYNCYVTLIAQLKKGKLEDDCELEIATLKAKIRDLEFRLNKKEAE